MNNFENDLKYLKELIEEKADRKRIVLYTDSMYNKLSELHNQVYKVQCEKQIKNVLRSTTEIIK